MRLKVAELSTLNAGGDLVTAIKVYIYIYIYNKDIWRNWG